jgi:hypothetical protein
MGVKVEARNNDGKTNQLPAGLISGTDGQWLIFAGNGSI